MVVGQTTACVRIVAKIFMLIPFFLTVGVSDQESRTLQHGAKELSGAVQQRPCSYSSHSFEESSAPPQTTGISLDS